MSAPALAAPGGRTLTIRGTPYPVLLPTIRDARLHLASVIITLQVLGQAAFDFRVSIAQILLSLGTCALLEVGIAKNQLDDHYFLFPVFTQSLLHFTAWQSGVAILPSGGASTPRVRRSTSFSGRRGEFRVRWSLSAT